jgi:hypothetical protein
MAMLGMESLIQTHFKDRRRAFEKTGSGGIAHFKSNP